MQATINSLSFIDRMTNGHYVASTTCVQVRRSQGHLSWILKSPQIPVHGKKMRNSNSSSSNYYKLIKVKKAKGNMPPYSAKENVMVTIVCKVKNTCLLGKGKR